jgi:hypothetical protein
VPGGDAPNNGCKERHLQTRWERSRRVRVLTKTVFAYTVMQLVDQGKLKLVAETNSMQDVRKVPHETGPHPILIFRTGVHLFRAGFGAWLKSRKRLAGAQFRLLTSIGDRCWLCKDWLLFCQCDE